MAEATEEKIIVPAPGMPIKVVILIAAVTLLVGLAGTVAFFKFTGKDKTEPTAEVSTPAPDKHGEPTAKTAASTAAAGPGVIYDLDPFIVNLADAPESRYLKITIKLELDRADAGAELAARVPHVRDAVLILLTSKDAASLRTPQGKFQLREEITQRVNSLLPKGGVRSAYFTEFVVQ